MYEHSCEQRVVWLTRLPIILPRSNGMKKYFGGEELITIYIYQTKDLLGVKKPPL